MHEAFMLKKLLGDLIYPSQLKEPSWETCQILHFPRKSSPRKFLHFLLNAGARDTSKIQGGISYQVPPIIWTEVFYRIFFVVVVGSSVLGKLHFHPPPFGEASRERYLFKILSFLIKESFIFWLVETSIPRIHMHFYFSAASSWFCEWVIFSELPCFSSFPV